MAAFGQPALAVGADEEVTADGLQRIDPAVIETAWIRPGVDLSSYSKMLLMPTVVTFKDVSEVSASIRGRAGDMEFPISDARRVVVSKQFGEIFHDVFAEMSLYEVSTDVGRDVVMVRGFLLDLSSGAPPDIGAVRIEAIRWLWEASLVIELRDSMSDEVLARTFDRQRAIGPFEADAIVRDSPRVLRRWSQLLHQRLGELTGR